MLGWVSRSAQPILRTRTVYPIFARCCARWCGRSGFRRSGRSRSRSTVRVEHRHRAAAEILPRRGISSNSRQPTNDFHRGLYAAVTRNSGIWRAAAAVISTPAVPAASALARQGARHLAPSWRNAWCPPAAQSRCRGISQPRPTPCRFRRRARCGFGAYRRVAANKRSESFTSSIMGPTYETARS
jgi:hypothetical protein